MMWKTENAYKVMKMLMMMQLIAQFTMEIFKYWQVDQMTTELKCGKLMENSYRLYKISIPFKIKQYKLC